IPFYGAQATGPGEEPELAHRCAPTDERLPFRGRSPVGAPGRVAGGHFRRAQPSQFAHGCAPTGERLRGYFFVGRNSFRFSVPLVPFQRANRSAGKKRNEFRSTAPRLRVLGKSQNWLIVAHQLTSAYDFSQLRPQLLRSWIPNSTRLGHAWR